MTSVEIVGLIELVRTLVGRKAELDKEYFENFVQPAWEAFVRIHENYKSSFREYAEFVPKNEQPSITLDELIRRDAIHAANLRSELGKMLKNLPSAAVKARQIYLSDYVKSMDRYFDIESTVNLSLTAKSSLVDVGYNRLYLFALRNLGRMGENRNKEEERKMFDQLVVIIQIKYEKVADAYYRLRKELLT